MSRCSNSNTYESCCLASIFCIFLALIIVGNLTGYKSNNHWVKFNRELMCKNFRTMKEVKIKHIRVISARFWTFCIITWAGEALINLIKLLFNKNTDNNFFWCFYLFFIFQGQIPCWENRQENSNCSPQSRSFMRSILPLLKLWP